MKILSFVLRVDDDPSRACRLLSLILEFVVKICLFSRKINAKILIAKDDGSGDC